MVFGFLKEGKWYFLILAFILQILYFSFQSEIRRSLYSILGIHEKFWDMLKMTFSAMFLGTAIPSLHMSAMALFMSEAKAKKYSQSKALVASLTFILFDFLGFFFFLILALVLLFKIGDLNKFQIFGAVSLVAIISATAAALVYTLKKESHVHWVLGKVSRLIPKKKRREWMPQTEIDLIAKEAIEAKTFYSKKKYNLWLPLAMSLLTQTSGALTLMACFLAFGVPFTFTVIMVVYAMAMLFQMVAITPYGIGTAEVALTVTLTSVGIDAGTSILIMMTFRFFTFWLPMTTGYISTKRLSFMRGKKLNSL